MLDFIQKPMLCARVVLASLLCETGFSLLSYREHDNVSWDAVNATILFVGTGRSGSSLVGSLLDAHPRIVIANEYDLATRVAQGAAICSRHGIWNRLYGMSARQAEHGRQGGGFYEYFVPNMWQGSAMGNQPFFMGDKKAGIVGNLGFEGVLESVAKIRNCTGRPVKLIYVSRNPYDIISTMALRGVSTTRKARSNQEQIDAFDAGERGPIRVEPGAIRDRVDTVFKWLEVVQRLSETLTNSSVELIEVPYIELITNPHKSLSNLCHKLDLECSKEYLDACASIVGTTDHYTRLSVPWQEEDVCYTMERILNNTLTAHFVTEAPPLEGRELEPRCGSACFPGGWPCPCAKVGARLDQCRREG